MSETISHGKVGIFHYTLTNDAGTVIDSSSGGEPMAYLHGFGNIVPGLEKELEGKAAGDSFKARVAPADGYGERQGDGPQSVHRSEFPKDMELAEGRPIAAQGADGERLILWITKIQGAQVWLDLNHPLAGQHLNFDIELVGVRDSTADEQTHGHAHGVHGHAHHH